MSRYERLADYEFTDCMVRSRDILGFVAQRFEDPDPLESRDTAAFFYYPNKPAARQWAFARVGEATGMFGAAVTNPEERWVFVMEDGAVFVVGGGNAGYEEDIPAGGRYFSSVRTLADGRACAVGPNRKMFVRDGVSAWTELADGLEENGETTKLDARGFRDICATSAGDIYAGGGVGDLWVYRQQVWHRQDVPTDAELRGMAAGADGRVYVLAGRSSILVGQDDEWRAVALDDAERFENIVEFDGRVLVSSRSAIFEVTPDGIVDASLGEPTLSSKSRIASRDGVLLLAGVQDAAMFDGIEWTVILEPK